MAVAAFRAAAALRLWRATVDVLASGNTKASRAGADGEPPGPGALPPPNRTTAPTAISPTPAMTAAMTAHGRRRDGDWPRLRDIRLGTVGVLSRSLGRSECSSAGGSLDG